MLKHTQSMQNVEVRFADTGHFHLFENVDSIDTLNQMILKQYKIEVPNQRLMSKEGNLISASDRLQNIASFKKSFITNSASTNSMKPGTCLYLFNHRILLKNAGEGVDIAELQAQSRLILAKKHETCLGLRENIYELAPIGNIFNSEQVAKMCAFNPSILEMAENWQKSTLEFINNFSTFKQNKYCLEQYLQRYENQRKAMNVLIKNLVNLTQEKQGLNRRYSEHREELLKIFEQKKMNQGHYSENHQKQIYSDISEISKKTNETKDRIKRNQSKIVEYKKYSRGYYVEAEKKLKIADEKANKNLRELEIYSKEMKTYYTKLMEAIKDQLEKGDDTKLTLFLDQRKVVEAKFTNILLISQTHIEEIEKIFLQVFGLYRKNQEVFRNGYRKYNDLYVEEQDHIRVQQKQIENSFHDVSSKINGFFVRREEKNIMAESKAKSTNLGEIEEKELNRRKYFVKKLYAIQQQIKGILKDEENARRLYVAEAIAAHDTYDHPILMNVKVPCFLLNFDETTDQDIPMGMSSRKKDLEKDFQFFQASTGMQRVLQQLEIIKNCQVSLKKEESTSGKIKNLQTILQKSAQVFHHVYSYKLEQNNKKYESREKQYSLQLEKLEVESNDLKLKMNELSLKKGAEGSERVHLLQQKISNLLAQSEVSKGENDLLRSKLKQVSHEYESKLAQAIEEGKKRQKVCKSDQKKLENKLMEQITMIEPLVQELEETSTRCKELQQINHEYKIVMGDQQVKIAALEARLKIEGEAGNSSIALKQSFYGQHLHKNESPKANHKQNLPASDYELQSSEVYQTLAVTNEELKNQIQLLRNEIADLRNENESLNEEIMKIAMKDTEDQSVQTDSDANNFAQSRAYQSSGVIIKDEPQEGQVRIFIPFNNGIYVALRSNGNRTETTKYLTGISEAEQEQPYVLDLNCLTTKARELLTQCTLVVVLKVLKIMPGPNKLYVEGEIQSAIGFEDQEMVMKDYGCFLKN